MPRGRASVPTRRSSPSCKKAYEKVTTPTTDRLRFEAWDEGLPKSGQWRNQFAVADMNGDGHLDIVHAPARKSSRPPIVFLGDGAGHWHRWEEAQFPQFPYDYGAAAVADFDGDGRPDIALGVHLKGVVVLVQKAPGRFELWNQGLPFRMSNKEDLGFSTQAIAALDWSGDGRPDLVAVGEGPQMAFNRNEVAAVNSPAQGVVGFENLGDGSWRPLELGNPEGARALFGNHIGTIELKGEGTGVLVASNVMGRSDLLRVHQKAGWQVSDLEGVRPLSYTRSIAVGDFDRVKGSDIALGYSSFEPREWFSGIDLMLRRDRGWERRPVYAEQGPEGIWALAAGDLDGDHRTDLVGLTGDGRMLVFVGDGDGGFMLEQGPGAAGAETAIAGCRGYDVGLADLDGDGRDEIVAEFSGESSGLPGVSSAEGCPANGSLRVWRAATAAGPGH